MPMTKRRANRTKTGALQPLPEGTYIWLVWGLTIDRCDLIATASSEETKARYIEAGERRGYKTVQTEYIMVDHAYGDRMLGSLRSLRRA